MTDEAKISPEQARVNAYLRKLTDSAAAISDDQLANKLIMICEQLDSEGDILINELIARYDRVRKR